MISFGADPFPSDNQNVNRQFDESGGNSASQSQSDSNNYLKALTVSQQTTMSLVKQIKEN
jgi:hypothetical protein